MRRGRAFGRILLVASALSGLAVFKAGPTSAAPRGGFSDFGGSWSGTGRVESAGGSETIRCRARYTVLDAGTGVEQQLVCASASYQFQIACRANDMDGRVSGTWSETTRNVSGSLSGALEGGRLQATVSSPIFRAGLSLVTRGASQEVVITPQGNDIRQVTIRMRRG